MKTYKKILGKILINYIRSKNKYFEVIFLKKINTYNLSYLVIICFILIKKYKFYMYIFIIKLRYILFYNNIMIKYLILKYI